MPGGPTDPEILLQAIAAGAVHDADRFGFGASPRVRFGLVRTGPFGGAAWHLSTLGAIGIDADTFAKLANAQPIEGVPGVLLIERMRYELIEADGMAELEPA